MKGPLSDQGVEGPVYADRVGGHLTFRDWEHWTDEDQDEYATEFMKRAPARVKLVFMIKHGLIDERFSP